MVLRRQRAELRKDLTVVERAVLYADLLVAALLPPLGVILLVGGAKAVGATLLLLGVVVMAVPISPFLRARVRRRGADAARAQAGPGAGDHPD